jgi:cell wall-associated NlpC family hydrolase
VTGRNGAWFKGVINGKEGFVYQDYVAENKPSVSSEGSDLGKQIAAYALQHLGCPYRWGGTSPDTGFDCSGFVWYVYKHFGYTIQRVACNQATEGVHVDHKDIQPGDILCFYQGDNYIGHSGIYIGNGQFIHSSTETTGVIISDLASDAYEARRLA